MNLGVFRASDIVERVEGWRPKAADEGTHGHGKHGKPMGTLSVDDVVSTKLIKTCGVENRQQRHFQKRAIKRYIIQLTRIIVRRNSRIMSLKRARKRSCL